MPGVEGEFVVCVSMLSEVGDVKTSPVASLAGFEFRQVALEYFLCTDYNQLTFIFIIGYRKGLQSMHKFLLISLGNRRF